MNLYNSKTYNEDLEYLANLDLPWEKLKDSSVLLSGSTGMLGSLLIDAIMTKNETDLNCTIYGINRNLDKARDRFCKWNSNDKLHLIAHDINNPLSLDELGKVNYVLHMASNTHPVQYATDPIGTITTNIIGVQNMLDFAVQHNASRFMFISSNEIYGENRGDTELFDEDYCGYINCNTMRAGYPESKRCGEALCQAYRAQKGLDIVIARPTRSYGPTMLPSDTKAISQFIKKGLAGEDIVLKSAGTQFYSYTYAADAVSGLLTIQLKGKNGEAYNIADEVSDITLKDLAELIADISGTKIVFELPDSIEAAGYSKATKARLSGDKIKKLGWIPGNTIQSGVNRAFQVFSDLGLKDSIYKKTNDSIF